MFRKISLIILTILTIQFTSLHVHAGSESVDTELMIMLDASQSVDAKEFKQQRDAYISVFKDPLLIKDIINAGVNKKISATLVYWSSPKKIEVAVDWQLISNEKESSFFAEKIARTTPFSANLETTGKPFDGTTAPGSAIAFALQHFKKSVFKSDRQVIMISSDGLENDGVSTSKIRDQAIKQGIKTINCLTIGSQALRNWYANNLTAGNNAKTISILDFESLPDASRELLLHSIAPK